MPLHCAQQNTKTVRNMTESVSHPSDARSKRSLTRWLVPLLILLLGVVAFMGLRASKPSHTPPPPKEKTWHVKVMPLVAGSHAPEIELQGRVEAPNRYRASAPGVGWVKAVNTREGAQVKHGEVLVELDPVDFTVALSKAEAELADIDAQLTESTLQHQQNRTALTRERQLLKLAKDAVDRFQRLSQKSLSSQSQLDNAQKEYRRQQLSLAQKQLSVDSFDTKQKQLEARKKRAEASVSQAVRALEQSKVVAPYDGVVSALDIAEGDRVNAGMALISLYAPAGLEVRALIPTRYQAELSQHLQQGMPLTAQVDNLDQALMLDRLAGIAQAGGVDGFFTASGEAAQLKPGGLLTLRLQRPSLDDVFAVPTEAIYNNTRLYLLRDGRMAGVDVAVVGQAQTAQGQRVVLVRSEEIDDAAAQLITTRLPNAATGLKVSTQAPAAQRGQGKPDRNGESHPGTNKPAAKKPAHQP